MKRVLITGIGGFVSAHLLAHVMKNTNWEVVGIDSFRHKGKTDRIADLLDSYPDYRDRLTIFTHDLAAPISDQLDARIGHIDYLLSVASESHVDRSIDEPRPFIENNVALILTVLEWARNRNIEKIIQISTDEVYGPAYEEDHPEGDPHRPSNPYAASKAAQEDIAYSYWRTYDMPIIIINCMNMIGQLQDTEKYFPKIIKAIQEDKEITVHVSPDGKPGSRYYLHARNLADALVYLLNNQIPTKYPAKDLDRFNIVSTREVDNMEMVSIVEKIIGKKAKIVPMNFHESRPGHDLRYGLTSDKMRSIGWEEPISFDEGAETTVMWYLEDKNAGWLR